MLTYYQVLELPTTATSEDIKKAWHEQLQVWHPDRFTHAPVLQRKAEARTTLINQAYQTLNDPTSRQRYDATTSSTPVRPHTTASPTPPPRPTTSAAPQPPPPRSRSEQRGPHLPIMLSRKNQSKIAVPAIHIAVDTREHMPYIFSGLTRIAGTSRQTLNAGDYAIVEAPDIFRVERKRAEELNTIFSNPSENRQRFIREIEPLLKFPHRFLVIEGALFQRLASGRLGQYHKTGLLDFLDALTARFGLQIIYAEHRDEAEERVANLATLHYAYYYAEQEGLGRYLAENDI